MDHYLRDESTKVWVKETNRQTFAYTDGDQFEQHLLSLFKSASDLSTNSHELDAAILDWPSEYHLSPARHNLLRPFPIDPGSRVLELGCGCGSMTRYFGENGNELVAVEGSIRRAQIAAARCKDLPNVNVVCDNIVNFCSEERFDYVTLIGVLEYAPLFIEADDPVTTCLQYAASFLKETGVLVIAIENQLGLKYFNGCKEDHVGVPFYGINGLYGWEAQKDPVTLGRAALASKLSVVGLSHQDWYYPFPDYKIPGLIVAHGTLFEETVNVADLLLGQFSKDRPESGHRAFSEGMAWRPVIENKLASDLSNSFLVFAGISEHQLPAVDWVAKIYSRGRRRACYRVGTSIEKSGAGDLIVRKCRLHPEQPAPARPWLQHVVADSDYITGELLLGRFHQAMSGDADIEALARCLAPWFELLLENTTIGWDGQAVLPGDYVDCIPANIMIKADDSSQYFDAEWASAEAVPLSWVAVRGVVYALSDCLQNVSLEGLTYRDFVKEIASRNGVSLKAEDFAQADFYEARMVAQCHADCRGIPRLSEILDLQLILTVRLLKKSTNYQDSLSWHQAELRRVKSTFSWRVTAPLRVIGNLGRRFGFWG